MTNRLLLTIQYMCNTNTRAVHVRKPDTAPRVNVRARTRTYTTRNATLRQVGARAAIASGAGSPLTATLVVPYSLPSATTTAAASSE
eukprot:8045714-Pyramimonas_sp.AAC.1